MDFSKAILGPVHLQKEAAERIATSAAQSQSAFGQLLALMSSQNVLCCKRAAWCFSLAAKLRPGWTINCQKDLVALLDRENPPDGLLRNTLRILRDSRLQPAFYDRLAYHCFNFVEDPKQAIAIRAFAMHILGQIGLALPDIRSEVKAIIDYYFTGQTHAGLVSSAKAVITLWNKADKQAYKQTDKQAKTANNK
ncbi:hypothetical protein GCM10027566_32540 [Arachidicoccus ginsenosidivorans]|jgi:hypothetical protein|uniref:HEAT repeat domain-containing protein n=1 Tax=Arachidicoccus ginsenosidivorans TaxID=496057 RepID=A0A5B8VJ32_9BACT|nr:hypothetical protein [Arachidicoccus ginsenosidivorans]QEC71470.1 hypothetical protein FSB73_07090 [Arachidicoccus ginsenosidivorans]